MLSSAIVHELQHSVCGAVQNVRVVQRNLVYVVGLPMECCFEDVLSSQDYIGQFGKIVKVGTFTASFESS